MLIMFIMLQYITIYVKQYKYIIKVRIINEKYVQICALNSYNI